MNKEIVQLILRLLNSLRVSYLLISQGWVLQLGSFLPVDGYKVYSRV